MYPKEADQGDGPVHTNDRPRRSPKQYSRFANFYTTHKAHAKRKKTRTRTLPSQIAKIGYSVNRSEHTLTANSATNDLRHPTRIRKMAINLEDCADSSGTEDNDIMAVAPQTSQDEQMIENDYLGGHKIGGGEGSGGEKGASEDAGGENSKTGHTRKTNTRTAASHTATMLCSKNGIGQALNANAVAYQTSKDEQIIEQECLGGREIGLSSEGAGCENCGSKGAGGKSSKTGCMKKLISDVELECVPGDGGMEKLNACDKYETSMNGAKEKDLVKSERDKAHFSEEYSIRECMNALNKLPGVNTMSYNKALQFLVILDWRKIFLHMPDDRKIGWLNDLK